MRYLLFIFIILVSCDKEQPELIYSQLVDKRDGQAYKCVEIGNQIWMAENLNYIDHDYYPDTINFNTLMIKPDGPLYYDNGKFGVLYNWEAAKTAAPEGWHIPTESDWSQLVRFTGDSLAGLTLKDVDYFRALPGGMKIDEFLNGQYVFGAWWGVGYEEQLKYSVYFIEGIDYVTKKDLSDDNAFVNYLSIRCVKD